MEALDQHKVCQAFEKAWQKKIITPKLKTRNKAGVAVGWQQFYLIEPFSSSFIF